MRNLLLIAIAVTSQAVVAAGGIYSWTDESGNLMYGDSPPDNVAAIAIDPPKLTVLEGFSSRYKDNAEPVAKAPQGAQAAETGVNGKDTTYSEVKIIAPKKGQAIRANDGDVSVALSLSPKLRSGDEIVVSLDGREVSRGKARVANLSNLDRGEHQLVIAVVDSSGQPLIASETVAFTVLRNSALINKPYSPYPEDANAVKSFIYSN